MTTQTLPLIDTKAIRANVPLIPYVASDFKSRGWELKEYKSGTTTTYHAGPCPLCGKGDDRFRILAEYPEIWFCRQCTTKGHDIIDYVSRTKRIDFVAASKMLSAPDMVKISKESALPEVKQALESPLMGDLLDTWQSRAEIHTTAALDHLYHGQSKAARAALDWLSNRGITKDIIANLGIGYNDHWRELAPGYKLLPGITLPRWQPNTIAPTAINVYLSSEARKLTGERRMYAKGSQPKAAMFNEWRLTDHQTVIILEGELDAALLTRFLPPSALAVATGGAETLPDDLSNLKERRLIIALDDDDAGERGRDKWLERLPSAEIAPPTGGQKDLTDFWKAGGNIKDWLGGFLR